jgi:hypothetical protein
MICPRFFKFICPSANRGRRECRVRAAPAVSCAKSVHFGAHEHTGSAETLRHPPRNGFTAYFVLSPVSGLVVTVTLRNTSRKAWRQHRGARTTRLDRTQQNHSPLERCVHRIPRPTCRDDGDTPLWWARDVTGYNSDFQNLQAKYFACRTDSSDQLEIAREFRFFAQRPSGSARGSGHTRQFGPVA